VPANRPVGNSEEAVEFRPLPGQEDDWAEFNYAIPAPCWYWLGTFPIALYFMAILTLIGVTYVG
jgi:hypothetical protein